MNDFNLHGWLFVDKPKGISSTKVVSEIKKFLSLPKKYKIGHGGTLDPMAEGVLPIAIGEATKTVDYVLNSDKIYEFTIQFGEKRDSKDSEGEIIEKNDKFPTKEEIITCMHSFLGEITQEPPAFSAIKINGQRAYNLARKGIEVKIPKRNVHIYALDLINFDQENRQVTFSAHVSKGTYIRTLAEDISLACNCLGYTIYLRRTKICTPKEKLLFSLNKIYNESSIIFENIISIEDMLDDISAYLLNKSQAIELLNGNPKSLKTYPQGIFKATYNGKVVALLENKQGSLNILRVFNNQRNSIKE